MCRCMTLSTVLVPLVVLLSLCVCVLRLLCVCVCVCLCVCDECGWCHPNSVTAVHVSDHNQMETRYTTCMHNMELQHGHGLDSCQGCVCVCVPCVCMWCVCGVCCVLHRLRSGPHVRMCAGLPEMMHVWHHSSSHTYNVGHSTCMWMWMWMWMRCAACHVRMRWMHDRAVRSERMQHDVVRVMCVCVDIAPLTHLILAYAPIIPSLQHTCARWRAQRADVGEQLSDTSHACVANVRAAGMCMCMSPACLTCCVCDQTVAFVGSPPCCAGATHRYDCMCHVSSQAQHIRTHTRTTCTSTSTCEARTRGC